MTAHEPTKSQIELLDGPMKGQCHERDITLPVPTRIKLVSEDNVRILHVYDVADFQGTFVESVRRKTRKTDKKEEDDETPSSNG